VIRLLHAATLVAGGVFLMAVGRMEQTQEFDRQQKAFQAHVDETKKTQREKLHELEQENQSEIDRIQEFYRRQQDEMNKSFEVKLSSEKERNEQILEKMRSEHQKELEMVQNEHEIEFDKVSKREQARLDTYKKNQDQTLERMQHKYLGIEEDMAERYGEA